MAELKPYTPRCAHPGGCTRRPIFEFQQMGASGRVSSALFCSAHAMPALRTAQKDEQGRPTLEAARG